jgi:hypothetical protein
MQRLGRLRRLLVIAAASCLSSGCFKATLQEPRSPVGETHDLWLHGFVFGLIGVDEIDTRFFCEAETAKVGVYQSAGTFTVTLLSLGIYSPRKAAITCAGGMPERRAP